MKFPSVQSLLKKYHIRPKKRLGQNYLIAQPTMQKIVDALGVSKKDAVLEIGCGFGVMTAMIAERGTRVIAVDADESSLEIAQEEFGSLDNVEWIHADILKTDLSSFAKGDKILVIGNVPYNISSPILFHLIDHRVHIERAVLMMQKEVVDRVVAKPGGKDYGALSVMLQSYAQCTKLFNVAKTNFIPPPKVMSSVIELCFSEKECRVGTFSHQRHVGADGKCSGNRHVLAYEDLRCVVQAAFQQRRKTLRNALLGSTQLKVKSDDLDRVLSELAIDARRRPETLSVEEFHLLAHRLCSIS